MGGKAALSGELPAILRSGGVGCKKQDRLLGQGHGDPFLPEKFCGNNRMGNYTIFRRTGQEGDRRFRYCGALPGRSAADNAARAPRRLSELHKKKNVSWWETLKKITLLDFWAVKYYPINSLSGDARVHYYELPGHSTKWRGRLTRKDVIRVGVRCGIVETCRNGPGASLPCSEA